MSDRSAGSVSTSISAGRAFALGAAAVLLLASAPAAAGGLTKAFRQARSAAAKSGREARAEALSSGPIFRAESFVPSYCRVRTWCLVKATNCFVGRVERPEGLWQAHAQYSVVRRAVASCPTGYGEWGAQAFLSPVEPVPFASGVETSSAAASAQAFKLCVAYRRDWVSAAPVCPAK